ncbi:hypothetical protein HDU81_003305 [Chytriomyces hyalinus]|nr:hypothetical protein HDU81_003305 [Chytriomyces hyalinus]
MRRRQGSHPTARQTSPSFIHARPRQKEASPVVGSYLAIAGSIVSSVAIVMVNKHILSSGFPFASTLTALHQLFGFFFTNALIGWRVIPQLPPPMPKQRMARTVVAALYASGLVLMNQSLALNSVSFYQLLKMSCIPTIAVLQFLTYGTTISLATTHSLVFILLGVFISTTADPTGAPNTSHPANTSLYEMNSISSLLYAFYPSVIALLAVVSTALSQILLNRSPDLKRLSSLQSIAALSFMSFLVCGTAAIAVDVGIYPGDWVRLVLSLSGVSNVLYSLLPNGFEWLLFSGEEMDVVMRAAVEGGTDYHEFLDGVSSRAYLTEHILGKFVSFLNKVSGPSTPLAWVFVSCLLSVLTNLFGFAVIKETSAITYQVVGHFKTVLTLGIGALLFGTEGLVGAKGVGLVVALIGMVLYSTCK